MESILTDVHRPEEATLVYLAASVVWMTLCFTIGGGSELFAAPAGPEAQSSRDPRSAPLAANHWAFQPVKRPVIPEVRDKSWARTPVDAFILAKLEANGMSPSGQADKRTLIRRATYDLMGLPPTPEEVAEFLADQTPEAFARAVDRLLSSPHYGERWGRHWLDLARYANTVGDTPGADPISPHAFTYRDYVIRALNEDLSYDRFLLEQIAADQLELGADKRALAALGFITVGRRFLNNIHDTIADRIDVATQGLLGLTVSCARCHDHKYDPIPTRDYYSLYGIFASSTEPEELPLLGIAPDPKAYADYLSKRKEFEEKLKKFVETTEADMLRQHRKRSGDYLFKAAHLRTLRKPDQKEALVSDGNLERVGIQRWKTALEKWDTNHPIFAPWFAFAALPEKEFAAQAEELAAKIAAHADAAHPINSQVARAFGGKPPASLKEVAERYGKLFEEVNQYWEETMAILENQNPKSKIQNLPNPAQEALRQILYGDDAPGYLPSAQLRALFGPGMRVRMRQIAAERDKLDATHPGCPPRAMALVDSPSPQNSRVFLRGNPNTPGEEVPRQFLEVLAGKNRQPFTKGSGRLQLAQAISHRENPLTARVIVNRVWLHHFGAGLVTTPNDFGLRSDPPSHPELLDYLAWRFMDEGWSLKKLHRWLMLSSVYQQKSDDHLRFEKLDPDNRFLAKMNRRRLDFESMRDTLLYVAGNLDLSFGARPVHLAPLPARVGPDGKFAAGNEPKQFANRRAIW